MAVLTTLKTIRLNGEIIQPDAMIQVEDEQGLIDKGYARRLTNEEAQTILDSFMEYAMMVFSEPR